MATATKIADDLGDPAAGSPDLEARLLLCCGSTRIDPERFDRVRDLARADVDWERLLAAAGRHGMTPLLHRHLSALGPGLVPDAVRDRLRAAFEANTRHNLSLAAELVRALAAAEARGLSFTSYKGP